MKSKMDRLAATHAVLRAPVARRCRPAAAIRVRRRSTLGIVLDQATIMKLPEKVSTIVVGNPLIADVAVQSGGLVVVTGKGYGTTNLIVLDRTGTVLMERSIVVRGASDQYRCGLPRRRARDLQLHADCASAASRSAIPPPTSRRRSARPMCATASRAEPATRASRRRARPACASRRRSSRSWLAKRERGCRVSTPIQTTIRQHDFATISRELSTRSVSLASVTSAAAWLLISFFFPPAHLFLLPLLSFFSPFSFLSSSSFPPFSSVFLCLFLSTAFLFPFFLLSLSLPSPLFSFLSLAGAARSPRRSVVSLLPPLSSSSVRPSRPLLFLPRVCRPSDGVVALAPHRDRSAVLRPCLAVAPVQHSGQSRRGCAWINPIRHIA